LSPYLTDAVKIWQIAIRHKGPLLSASVKLCSFSAELSGRNKVANPGSGNKRRNSSHFPLITEVKAGLTRVAS
jgi:hypothetical protein